LIGADRKYGPLSIRRERKAPAAYGNRIEGGSGEGGAMNGFQRRATACAALACALLAASAVSHPASARRSSVPALPASSAEGLAAVRAAAAQIERGEAGIVGFRVVSVTQIRGGPVHRVIRETDRYLLSGGAPLAKRVLAYDRDGKAATSAELARMSAAADGPLSRIGLRLPYRASAVDRYAYGSPVRTAVGETISFTALDRDAAHGDGTLTLNRTGAAERVAFVPAALPDRSATGAQITVEFGPVGGDRRDVTAIVRHFTGRRLLVRGTVDETGVYDDYRVFPAGTAAAIDAR